jgi:chemotaxis protein CheD
MQPVMDRDLDGPRVNVVQGMTYVSAQPAVLTTVLGSCVACCLFDPQMRIGGMNHFLLAQPRAGALMKGGEAERYGLYAMELLINEMLKAGAMRSQLRAHLYGGANLHAGMHEIGSANAAFAREFLERDGIPLVHSSLGGGQARRIDFRTAAGQARCRLVDEQVQVTQRMPVPNRQCGELELFW